MTEKDLLKAFENVSSKYTEEARERAAAAQKKPRRPILMRTAAAAVGAAACFGLVMFGLTHRPEHDLTVAESDIEAQVTQIVQSSAPAAETVTTDFVPRTAAGIQTAKSAVTGTASKSTAQTTEQSAVQTDTKTATQTTESAAKGTTAAPVPETTVPSPAAPFVPERLTFELVPRDKTGWVSAYDNGLADHVYRAQPGEEIWVDFRIKKDPCIRYGKLSLELGKLELVGQENGSASGSGSIYETSFSKPANAGLADTGSGTGINCHTIQFYSMDKDTPAADDSILCSLHVKVPKQSGCYPLTVAALPFWNEVRTWFPAEYGASIDLPEFTFYGLDFLVGDTPEPEQAAPIGTELLYWDSYYANDPEHRRADAMRIGAEGYDYVRPGERNVPIPVFVDHNDGFETLTIKIYHPSDVTAREDANGILFHKSDVMADITCTAEQSGNNEWTFRFTRGSNANLKTNGYLGTFYINIPEDANSGYDIRLRTEVQDIRYPDGSPLTYYTEVEGKCHVIDTGTASSLPDLSILDDFF